MEDLERKLQEHVGCTGLIVSDGVFSMDGDIVNLPGLVGLAQKYKLLSMIDEVMLPVLLVLPAEVRRNTIIWKVP